MSSAKKAVEGLCSKCLNKSGCENKVSEGVLVLVRCLDFVSTESSEKEE